MTPTTTSRSSRCPACGRRKKRSSEANARYWALLGRIADKIKPDGKSYNADPHWHTYFKQRFLGCTDIRMPNGKVITEANSSADLEPDEFSDYMTKVEAWAADHDCYLDE